MEYQTQPTQIFPVKMSNCPWNDGVIKYFVTYFISWCNQSQLTKFRFNEASECHLHSFLIHTVTWQCDGTECLHFTPITIIPFHSYGKSKGKWINTRNKDPKLAQKKLQFRGNGLLVLWQESAVWLQGEYLCISAVSASAITLVNLKKSILSDVCLNGWRFSFVALT